MFLLLLFVVVRCCSLLFVIDVGVSVLVYGCFVVAFGVAVFAVVGGVAVAVAVTVGVSVVVSHSTINSYSHCCCCCCRCCRCCYRCFVLVVDCAAVCCYCWLWLLL